MKACVVYLIRGGEASLAIFARSLRLLKENFLPWSPADVIVFHEGNVTERDVYERYDGVRIRLAQVDFSAVPPELEDVPPARRGYRHMCHFFSNDIFNHSGLEGYDYYMRLDDDSFILSPLRFNVFEHMARHGVKYAYRAVVTDKEVVCRDLWPTAREYFKKAGCARDFSRIKELGMYYTNFEICDLAWFRASPYQNFFRAIDAAGGIWRHRWGDAPIRYLGVQGLLKDDEILCLKELHYFHQSEWRAGFKRRLPWDYLRYCWWLGKIILRQRLGMG